MSRLAHLSDLHFGAADRHQSRLHDGLVATIASLHGGVDALLLTGDVFDSSRPAPALIDGFLALLDRLTQAVGRSVPTVLIPGNHDRRDDGVFGPWDGSLFHTLAARLADRPHVQVLGNATPFLGQRVSLPGIDADVVAYDSSYLPRGLISAGGQLRQEDLLQLGSELPPGDRPLLFLLHHHLVPTPITDTSVIATEGRPAWQRFLVQQVLPSLVGQGDREELTMTALGAGTALSTLHTLGRAVVVLHGHKHYPTARLLKGLGAGDGDVLLTSAGSCGKAQDWSTGDWDEAPRLWPSINVLELTPERVDVVSQAWSPAEPSRRNSPRALVRARREARRWELEPSAPARPFEPIFATNEANVALLTSTSTLDRYDLAVQRRIEATPKAYVTTSWDIVDGPPDARATEVRCNGASRPDARLPTRLEVPLHGESTWRVVGGVLATLTGAGELKGQGASFSSVELHNRSRAGVARLVVDLGPVKTRPFASATDLTTGTERPWPFTRSGDTVTIEYLNCPARTLLRLYWPLS
jgi:3',5'-cyclic AMP phosphodiesterase CpdA